MPYKSEKQRRWAHTPSGKDALGPEGVKEWDEASKGSDLPEEAASGDGKKFDVGKTIRKVSRDTDPHKGKRRGGYHGTPKGKKGYTRKPKHPGQSNSEALTPIDETYRDMNYPIAKLNWSTHKAETFKDTGEKGLHPAWGLKSIIDRGVKTHEKSQGDKRIGEADHQITKRDVKGKSFKSYSMVYAFNWS